MSNNIVTADWVVGRYSGLRAKSILAHVEHGIGYIILENGGNKNNPEIMVAFRVVFEATGGIPPHLVKVTDPLKIQKYEKVR